MCAKKPVPVLRQVATVRKPVSGGTSRWLSACSKRLYICLLTTCLQVFRDPRFDDLSGEYKPEIFEKTYKFIDDIRSREKQVKNIVGWGAEGYGGRESDSDVGCLSDPPVGPEEAQEVKDKRPEEGGAQLPAEEDGEFNPILLRSS